MTEKLSQLLTKNKKNSYCYKVPGFTTTTILPRVQPSDWRMAVGIFFFEYNQKKQAASFRKIVNAGTLVVTTILLIIFKISFSIKNTGTEKSIFFKVRSVDGQNDNTVIRSVALWHNQITLKSSLETVYKLCHALRGSVAVYNQM